MRSAGNVTWGQDGSAMLNVTYDSLTSDSQVGFSATALLNTTIREVSPLRGEISYTQSSQHIDAVFDLEVCTYKVKAPIQNEWVKKKKHWSFVLHNSDFFNNS